LAPARGLAAQSRPLLLLRKPTGWRLADPRQHAFGGLEIGQLSGNLFAVGIEARKPLADLRLLCADLVQYRRCCGWHGDLQ